MTDTPMIQTKGLTKYFKTSRGMLHAVDSVDISIQKNKTLGVVGESGCGKSTLGRTILRLIEPTRGDILFKGKNIVSYSKTELQALRKSMQIVFQDPYACLNPRKTVSELIADPMKVYRVPRQERNEKVRQLMETVGLAERFAQSFPHELDGGRRQRIGIARALSLDPEFIVCDEPVSALDVSIQAQILNLLMDLQESKGLTYMFITHDLSVVRHISDEIIVMYLGVVVEHASSEELFNNPLHPYTKELLKAIPVPDLKPEHKLGTVIRGEVSDPIEPPESCRFAPRCRNCTKECQNKMPQLVDVGNNHKVSCLLYNSEESVNNE